MAGFPPQLRRELRERISRRTVIDGFSAWAIRIMDSLPPEAELGLMLKETRGAGQTLQSGPQQLIVSLVSETVENVERQANLEGPLFPLAGHIQEAAAIPSVPAAAAR